MFRRRLGFSLHETILTICIVGCITAIITSGFNYLGFKNNTIEAKQAKVSSALKSATKSILGNEQQISITQACDPIAMRNLYLERLNNAELNENIIVNGKSLPSIKIPNFGIIAFEASPNCESSWHAMSSSTISTNDNPVILYSVLDDVSTISVPSEVTSNKSNFDNTNFNSHHIYCFMGNSCKYRENR